MIKLGDKVRDKITGFVGIVVVKSEWLYGCIRFGVQPLELKDGKPLDAYNFDEPQLELVEEGKAEPALPTGGMDRMTPPRAQDPSR